MSDTDLEALSTPKIRSTIQTAINNVGNRDFASIAGLTQDLLKRFLIEEGTYIPVSTITLACQVNKTHGDRDLNHTSVTECLKGSIVRLPQQNTVANPQTTQQSAHTRPSTNARKPGPLYDQKTFRLLNFGGNTITILVIGYFLGGIALAPLVGLPACVGFSPCLGSILGLIIGAFGSLAYTAYYFIKKM